MLTSLTRMVDLHAHPGGDLRLAWTDTQGADARTLRRAEIVHLQKLVDALGLVENRGRAGAIVEARTALSAALFALLDGPERVLTQAIDAAEVARCHLDLVVRARAEDRSTLSQHPATWMRWELLPFAVRRRPGAPPFTVVLQLGSLDLGQPRVLARGGLRILFMAFSPHDAPPELDFEHEEEALLDALAPLIEQRRARLRVVEEGTLDDLCATLLVERFDVVHLTGHGVMTPEGPRLVMENTFGARRLVSPAELFEVLARAGAMPELVMLSTCHSAEVRGSVASFAAQLVAAGVPNVLGWTRPVRDEQATLAAAVMYEQLGAGKTPVEAAEIARERMRSREERSLAPTHAWATLHLVSRAAGGFRVDNSAAPVDDHIDRDEVYDYLGGHMRVLKTGFVGRRRLVQRLLRVLLRGEDARPDGTREVAGACVFGMKGVGKSCAVGRAIERAKQVVPELRVVVLHGVINELAVHEAFRRAIATSGGDEAAERLLARTDEAVARRVERVMALWRERHVAIVLDDFEQNLERRSDGPWRVTNEAAALLDAILPVCVVGKPKLLITSTAELEGSGDHARSLALVPLGSFDAAAVQKLWMRGQASNELASVSLRSWQHLAERLGRNPRILAWARSLCAGKADDEMVNVATRALAALPVWSPGDEASEEKHAELSRLFLQHMAYAEARAAFGADALAFVKRARVFDAAVPKEAFAALAEGLAVDLDRDLEALASWGLLEVGEMDGERAYRVSPLVEARFDVANAARWHEAAAAAWEELATKATNGARFERVRTAWEHALQATHGERADRLAHRIEATLLLVALNAENLRLAERHLAALPESPFGYRWAGYAEVKVGRRSPRAVERVQRGLALHIRNLGTEEHPDVHEALHVLGNVLHAQGDLTGARTALERALAIEAGVYGTEDHHSVAASLRALGDVLQAQGDLTGARTALERALAIHVKVLGTEEHPSVAASLHGLGGVLLAQGDLASARKTLERALANNVKFLGTEEHPDVAASLHGLGDVLQDQGDLAGARTALERALAIKVKVLGTEEHPSVAASLHALVRVLQAQGDLASARKTLERAIAINVKVLGTEEHPFIASSLQLLGSVLHGQGDLAGARTALERARAIEARVFGTEEHPDVAASLHVLGCVLHGQGDLAGARTALERALAIYVKVLGTEEHRSVAASLRALGHVLQDQGDLAGARTELGRALAIYVKVLGTEEHPSVAASLYELGRVLRAQGDLAGARMAVQRALAIYVKVLGTEEHYSVATFLLALGRVLHDQGDLVGARAAFERSLAVLTRVLGTSEHPHIDAVTCSLGRVLEAQGDTAGSHSALRG